MSLKKKKIAKSIREKIKDRRLCHLHARSTRSASSAWAIFFFFKFFVLDMIRCDRAGFI